MMPTYFDTKRVAEMFAVTEETIRNWIEGGAFPNAKKFGGRWRIPESDIVNHVEAK